MENEVELKKILDTHEELKEKAELYYKCINLNDIKILVSPSLKYGLYNANLFIAFKDRIHYINSEIDKLKKKLANYKGNKFNVYEEMEKLNKFSNELISIEKEEKNMHAIYEVYLAKMARKYDEIKSDVVKNVYIKSSEDIILKRIKNFLNIEKKFLNIYEILYPLIKFFNN